MAIVYQAIFLPFPAESLPRPRPSQHPPSGLQLKAIINSRASSGAPPRPAPPRLGSAAGLGLITCEVYRRKQQSEPLSCGAQIIYCFPLPCPSGRDPSLRSAFSFCCRRMEADCSAVQSLDSSWLQSPAPVTGSSHRLHSRHGLQPRAVRYDMMCGRENEQSSSGRFGLGLTDCIRDRNYGCGPD